MRAPYDALDPETTAEIEDLVAEHSLLFSRGHPESGRLRPQCRSVHASHALAQQERRMIADRTKAGLAVARARGIKLGNAKLAVDNQAAALSRAGQWPPNCNSDRAPWSAKTVERLAA
jgi:hypothetical protein